MILRNPLCLGALAWATAGCSLDMSRYPTGPTQDAAVVAPQQSGDGIAHLVVNAAQKYQTLEGFGAAVAWYSDLLTGFTSSSSNNDTAFRDLGLDILRFRDCYGRQDQGNSSDISDEVTILARATSSLAHAPKVLLSSWSPPGNLKASGHENCTGPSSNPAIPSDCTLASDNNGFVYDAFANYFVESLDYYAASGIVPDYLSIQNEPNFIPTYEGCYFSPTETSAFPGYDKALSTVRAALTSVPDTPKIVGPELESLGSNVLDTYVTDTTRGMFDDLAHHLYSNNYWKTPDSYLTQMTDANATAKGLPLFETEFDTQNDGGTGGGFETAWVMHNSLAVEGVSMFLYWSLIWPGTSGGLIVVNGTTRPTYTLRGQYYAMRHYARYTDPGYVRVDVSSTQSNVRVSAYLAPDNSQLTLVLLNVGTNDAPVKLDSLSDFSWSHTEAYQSTFATGDAGTSEYWKALDGFDMNQQFTLPSRSVLTVVLNSSENDAQ